MPNRFRLRRATAADAAVLAELGARTFADSFAHSTSAEDLARFIAATYSPGAQRAELLDPAVCIFVAEAVTATEPDCPVGFAMLRAARAPACVTGPRPIELARLYARREVIGQGVGHRLVTVCAADACERGYRTVWLGVWERNDRALAFYGRHGFRDVGAHTFTVGSDAQTDRIMECAL